MTHVPTVILSRTAAGLAGLGRRVEVPSKIGPVTLMRPIGEGGMSVVHMGRHELLQKTVAVKFLLDIPGSPEDPRFTSFIEGARAAAAIQHPGLNIVYNADSVQGVPYLVMELIEGPSVADLLKKYGAFPLHVARTIIEDMCAAVAELHAHEMIHRDIKPANVMIDQTGRVVVTDFGLAMQRPAALFGGPGGGVAGTPSYMAPEMFEGNVSTRSDVYAMGVMIFEVLVGKPPFEGDFKELRLAHRTAAAPVAPLAARGLSEQLIVLVERTLHKDVLFRPKSARHVLDAFTKACDAAKIARATDSQIQRYMEVGHGGSSAAPGAAATPTPAYYERLNTLAEVKRRTPEATLVIESSQAAPEGRAPEGVIAPAGCADPGPAAGEKRPVEGAAQARLAVAFGAWPAGIVLSIGSAVVLCFGFFLAGWLQTELILLFDALGLVTRATGEDLTMDKMLERLPWLATFFVEVAPLALCIGVPLLLTWWLYIRVVLARPRPDGTVHCGWCGKLLAGLRDLRCAECGRFLAPAPGSSKEVPIARRPATRVKNTVVAAAVFFGFLGVLAPFYLRIVNPALHNQAPQLNLVGFSILFGLALPASALALAALHFMARGTACLTGRTYCGKCGAEFAGMEKPECPACGTHI